MKQNLVKLCFITFKDVMQLRSQEGNKHHGWEFHFESSGYLYRSYNLKQMQFLKENLAGKPSREIGDDWWGAPHPQMPPSFHKSRL